jgi:hypothetical protein
VTTIKLACPRCYARVRGATLMVDATIAIDRTCRDGHWWRVVIRPIRHDEDKSLHKVEWTLLAEKRRPMECGK